MAVEFYNVKTRQEVSVDESKVTKVVYDPNGKGPRYALRAEHAGTKLTKFVSKAIYDAVKAPQG